MKTLKYGSIQLAAPLIGSVWDQAGRNADNDFLYIIARGGSNVPVVIAQLGIPETITSKYKIHLSTTTIAYAYYTSDGDILIEFKDEFMLMDIPDALDWFQSFPMFYKFLPAYAKESLEDYRSL